MLPNYVTCSHPSSTQSADEEYTDSFHCKAVWVKVRDHTTQRKLGDINGTKEHFFLLI